ncbi:hypothetical protein D3C71_1805810 [compost metagenome]
MTTPPWAAPTTWPRSCGAAAVAAKAISPWVMAVPNRPRHSMPASKAAAEVAAAVPNSAATRAAHCHSIRRRRSMRSPRDTSSTRARAQPACVAATTAPMAAGRIPKSAASASSRGWA